MEKNVGKKVFVEHKQARYDQEFGTIIRIKNNKYVVQMNNYNNVEILVTPDKVTILQPAYELFKK